MRVMPLEIGTLHFVGIGGIGMSGIAEILHAMGYDVQGSDLKTNSNVKRLIDKGVRIETGHDAAHLCNKEGEPVSVVVVSSAVREDNAELQEARRLKIPVVRRAEMLAELMRLKWSIAIGGTHGKTTTTSMVGAMLEEGGLDPTVINGGIVNRYGTNTRFGRSDWMVVESDESDGTFTRLPATVSVVTNIDPEHMEEYGTFDNLRKAYRRFVENVPFYGFAVLCSDHPEVKALISGLSDRRMITYGLNPQADVRAHNLRIDAAGSTFDVTFAAPLNNGEELTLRDVYLAMPGRHNVQNALAALAIGQKLEMAPPLMKKALAEFSGVDRRFTRTGESRGVTIIDDYAHHPVEIAAVLETARMAVQQNKGRIVAVMQPHRYSRLDDLFEEFCGCFHEADTVIVADIYEAGETPIKNRDKEALARGIRDHGHRDVRTLETRDSLPSLITGCARPGDFVICLGAGDITHWANELPEALEKEHARHDKKRA